MNLYLTKSVELGLKEKHFHQIGFFLYLIYSLLFHKYPFLYLFIFNQYVNNNTRQHIGLLYQSSISIPETETKYSIKYVNSSDCNELACDVTVMASMWSYSNG